MMPHRHEVAPSGDRAMRPPRRNGNRVISGWIDQDRGITGRSSQAARALFAHGNLSAEFAIFAEFRADGISANIANSADTSVRLRKG